MIYGHRERAFREGDLSDLAVVIAETTGHLRAHAGDFDVVACSGVSGLLVAPAVAVALGKPLAVVRKRDDRSCHSERRVEGSAAGKRYVLVDDFVASGKTRDFVDAELAGYGARRVMTYQYANEKCSTCDGNAWDPPISLI